MTATKDASSVPRASAEATRAETPEVDIIGIRFARIDEAGCVDLIVREGRAGRGGWVITPNLDIVRQCAHDAEIRGLVDRADLRVADGMPVIWASRLQRTPLPERVCGSNLVSSLSAAAAQNGLRVYLLGGADDTAERSAEILTQRHPEFKIAGTESPPFGFEKDDAAVGQIADRIATSRADIVFVALGFPKAERVVERIRAKRPEAWWIGVGVSFSFLSGDVRRAPRWMQRLGLEWLHRLTQQPGHLARRYLLHDIPFALRLCTTAAWRGVTGARK